MEDTSTRSPNWLKYLGYGCGTCVMLLVVAYLGLQVAMSAFLGHILSKPPTTPAGPYKFDYHGDAACTVPIPDGYGSVDYRHVLVGSTRTGYGEGQRALMLNTKYHKGLDRPLRYYAPRDTRIGVYWYPAVNGKGPYLRLLDSCGETIVDVQRGVTREVMRLGGRVYAGDMVHGLEGYGYGRDFTSGRPRIVDVTYDGKPAEDVTGMFIGKGQYLGSVVRVGNRLTFSAPKPSKSPPTARIDR